MVDNKELDIKYRIRLDIKKDAWNWYDGCTNTPFHGNDWTKGIPKEIIEKLQNSSEKEAYEFLIPFLKNKYITDKKQIKKHRALLKNKYEQKLNIACKKVEDLLGKPIYNKDFTIFLTTFPRGPYNPYRGYMWEYVGWKDQIVGFLHELLHFQFVHYWRDNPDSPVNKLSWEQFDYLKEALTMILDEDLVPLIEWPDKGYEKHKELRKELTEFWKNNKNFNDLVEFGLKRIVHYVPSKKSK